MIPHEDHVLHLIRFCAAFVSLRGVDVSLASADIARFNLSAEAISPETSQKLLEGRFGAKAMGLKYSYFSNALGNACHIHQ